MHRGARLLALVVCGGSVGWGGPIACGESAPPPAAEAPAAGPSTARPELLEELRADLRAERHPGDGGGRAWLESADPPEPTAGGRGRFHFVYEAGPEGIAVGGSLQLQVSPFWDWTTPQVLDPSRPGYTEVTTEARGVELRPATIGRQLLGVEVGGRALAAGERVHLVYGAGPERAYVDRFAERDARFWFVVDADGDGVRGFVETAPAVTVRPGPAARLVLFLPATARPGEEVLLTAALLDAAGNAGPAFEGTIRIGGSHQGLEAPSEIAFTAADAGRRSVPVRVLAPGIHRLRGHGPAGLASETNPLRAGEDVPRILWGDLHGHSGFSDGTGLPEDWYAYARDVAALDVAALTDHDHWGLPFLDSSPELWEHVQAVTRRFHEPGRFVTLLGYEWTNWIHGHRHVLHFEDEAVIRSSVDPAFDEPAELWAALRGSRALTFAHHSAGGPVATDWSTPPDPELEPVTEIASVHGSSEALDSPRPIYSPVPGNFVRDALARGYRLGFVGSGDGHDGHPGLSQLGASSGGLAGILAEERTREAVLEALRARRVYATNGPRIVLDARLGDRPMGSAIAPGAHLLRVRAAAPVPLARLDVVTARGVLLEVPLEGERDVAFERRLPALPAGAAVYVRVVQEDDGAAWSSPFFFEAPAR